MLQCLTGLYVNILKKRKVSFNIVKKMRTKKTISKNIKLYYIF